MANSFLDAVIDLVCTRIDEHADELTRLDQAIGDGDRGSDTENPCRTLSDER